MGRISASAGPPPTAEDIEESRRLKSLYRDSLARVRASAEKWRNGLSIAAVLSAVVGYFITASSDGLDPNGRIGLLVAFVVLVIAAVVSIGASLRASIGFPTRVRLNSLDNLRRWERRELFFSIWLLRLSVTAATVAVAAAGVAILLLVFSSSTAHVVVVTTISGREVCGDSGQTEGSYLVVEQTEVRRYLDLSDIVSVDIAESCP